VVTRASGGDQAADRALAFELESIALIADRTTAIPEGWVARTPSLPAVWDLNHVGLTEPVELADLEAVLEREQGALPFRHLVVQHEPTGQRLERELPARGWKFERNVLMVLRREPDRGLDTSAVVEADLGDALGLMRRWTGESEALRQDPEAHRQVLETSRRVWQRRGARRLGVVGRDGALAGITVLFSDGEVAQVEDVYVVPEERGRGFGRVLVTRATQMAVEGEHEPVFIVADDRGWPKQLYAKIGFEPVTRTWDFHLGPGGWGD
jgi:GNAT superfamily N-acetyltransferase